MSIIENTLMKGSLVLTPELSEFEQQFVIILVQYYRQILEQCFNDGIDGLE